MNLITEVNKPKVTQSIIIYGGRFQPFHKGHYAAYQNLVSEFGKANVYIGTSNDTSSDKSPFTFKEKKEIATKMFGVPVTKFIKVNNPYRPMEILSKYDGKITQYIAAVGEKDASRLKSPYFKPYKGKAGYGYDEVGYYYTVPSEENPISGTDVRKKLGSSNKEVAKKFFLKAYPSFDKDIFKMITTKLNEDGMPGGIGVGLTLPGGYINGAPTGSKNEIIGEIENDVNEFITQYFNEGISESKENSINHFVEYATKKLKLSETPKITLLSGREYSEAKTSLGGYNPMSKEIYVAIEGRLTADILRTLAHEMVHRKQDELGLVKDEIKDGATGSPIENQAHAVAGILMRNYGKINKQIYNEAIDKKNIHNINLKLNSVSLKRFQTTPTFQRLLHSDQLKNLKIGDNKLVVNNTAWSVLQRLEGPGNYQIEKLKEDINIDVDKGDTVLMGKFKNKKVVVKDIGKDDYGMPTINGKKAATFRLGDKGQNIFKKEIDEVGEGSSKPYSFTQRENQKDNKVYAFTTTSKEEYKVEFDYKDLRDAWEMEFDIYFGSGDEVINKGEIYSVMATVTNIALDFIKKVNPKIIYFRAAKNFNNDNRREKLYLAYIKKQLPNWTLGKQSGLTTLTNPKYKNQPSFNEQIDELYKDIENFIDDYLGEVSNVQISNTADVPDGSFIPKGKKRKLNTAKSEDWYKNGGYTQTDFPKADAIFGDDDAEERTITYSIENLPDIDYVKTDFIKEGLLMEGGAYGHMSHPFDDMDLTFGDLKDIITKALNGELGVVREKTDGQALAISWKNGRLIAARNKGHLQNAGAGAMGIEDVASKFNGRGGLTDAYNFAMRDLTAAIGGLSDAQRKKIFNEGKCFMNLEVIWPTSVNVIPYGQALLVFHNTTCYDEKGTAIGADGGAAGTLAGMIKQVNADVQSKYTIQGPPITQIPKNENLSSKQSKYISKLKKLQSEFGLKDTDNVADYHQSWWDWWITSKAPIKVDKLTKEALIRRWAFGDKGFRLTTISKPELQEWAIDHDKVNVAKQQKDNIKPFEEIFLGVGADILEFVGSVLTVHPEKAIRAMKEKFVSVATQVRNGGSPAQIQKLKSELKRLNQLGGIEKIVANEGLVFFYNGKTYKLTGTFAPLNQILGIFYS